MSISNPSPYRIHSFALCYFTSMISYSAITTMMYSLYDRNNLTSVALVDGIFAYLGFGPTNMIVLTVIRKYNLKTALGIGLVGLVVFDCVVLATVWAIENQIPVLSSLVVIYLINIVSSFFAGISNSILWTIMPIYIQAHCDQLQSLSLSSPSSPQAQSQNSLTANMGLFWSICLTSNILAGLLNIFVLGYANQYAYMLVVCGIAGLSVVLVGVFVEPFRVPGIGYDVGGVTTVQAVTKQLTNLKEIFRHEKQNNVGFPNIFIFNFIAGLFLSFYLIFINKLIKKSLPEDTSPENFSKLTAIVFICQGLSSISMGLVQNKLYFLIPSDKQKCLLWAISALQIVTFITMILYNTLEQTGTGYWTCIAVIILWASTETHIKTSQQAYIRQYNGGRVECTNFPFHSAIDYSLSILFYSAGSIVNYLIQMLGEGNGELMGVVAVGVLCQCVWVLREPDIGELTAKASQLEARAKDNQKKDQDTEKGKCKLIQQDGQEVEDMREKDEELEESQRLDKKLVVVELTDQKL